MPNANFTFITRVDPISPPSKMHLFSRPGSDSKPDALVVEAPGTAPGSATSIP